MFKTELEWYTPKEKLPEQSKKQVSNIIWIDVAGYFNIGYFKVYGKKKIEMWVYGPDDYDVDITDVIKYWAYIDPLKILPS